MRGASIFLALGVWLAGPAISQECTGQWEHSLGTNPLEPKYFSGDTSAGYAIFSFWGNPNLRFEFRGEFPKARFMSYETQATRLSITTAALFDYQIRPDGDRESRYTIVASQEPEPGAANFIRLPRGRLAQSMMFRIYAPDGELLPEDLPRIFAFHKGTGAPAPCPKRAGYPSRFHFPQFLADIYTTFARFEFKVPGDMTILGLNQAAKYMYAVTPLGRGEVLLIRFKAPTREQARYWSFCVNNFPNNQTVNCLPDYAASPDEGGFVRLVIGRGEAVREEARARGYDFLPDARERRQRVMGFVYRNLVPTEAFRTNDMFQGAYVPRAVRCTASDFLARACRLE